MYERIMPRPGAASSGAGRPRVGANMKNENSTLARRSGLAAVLGATLTAGSVGAELVHGVEDGSSIVNLPLFLVYVGTAGLGMALLAAAIVGLRRLHRAEGAEVGRAGRVGFRLAVFGALAVVAFTVVYFVGAVATGETVEAAFLLFALGFLALLVGQVLLGVGLRRGGLLGLGWAAPLAGVAAIALAITTDADPYHDIGLFLFFGSWFALGCAVLWRYPRRQRALSDALSRKTASERTASGR